MAVFPSFVGVFFGTKWTLTEWQTFLSQQEWFLHSFRKPNQSIKQPVFFTVNLTAEVVLWELYHTFHLNHSTMHTYFQQIFDSRKQPSGTGLEIYFSFTDRTEDAIIKSLSDSVSWNAELMVQVLSFLSCTFTESSALRLMSPVIKQVLAGR